MGYSTTFSAGFVLGSVASQLNKDELDVARSLCRFSVESNVNLSLRGSSLGDKSLLSVYKNIISRGFPTYSSLYIEKNLGAIYGNALSFEDQSDDTEFKFQLDKKYKPRLKTAYTCFDPRCETIKKDLKDFKELVFNIDNESSYQHANLSRAR